jgi:hypothetical protein
LVGTLATSNQVVLSVPFHGNSSNVWSTKENLITQDTLRRIPVSNISYSYDLFTTPLYMIDDNDATAEVYYGSGDGKYLELEVLKRNNDTGAIIRLKGQFKKTFSGTAYNYFDINYTVTSACFNLNSESYKIKLDTYSGGHTSYIYLRTYCFDGGWTQLGQIFNGEYYSAETKIFDFGSYITNQSDFTAYSNPTVKTQYYNTDGLVWSNSFGFWGNQSDTTRNLSLYNEINTSQFGTAGNVTFNDTGGNFNTTSYIEINQSVINTGNITWSMSFSQKQNNNDYLIFAKSNKTTLTYDYGIYSPLNNQYACSVVNITGSEYKTDFYNLSNNTKIMMTCVYDSIGNNLTTYINGLYYSSVAVVGTLRNLETNYTIGAWNKGRANTGFGFNGTIYDLRIYNRSLSADEIRIMYQGGNFSSNKLEEQNGSIYLNGNEAIRVQNNTLSGITSYSTSQWVKGNNGNDNIWTLPNNDIWLMTDYFYNAGTTWHSNGVHEWDNIITTSNGSMTKIYYNGVLRNTSLNSNTPFLNNNIFTIGSYAGNPLTDTSTKFKGQLSDFLMYNYQLSANDISVLYNGYNSSLNVSLYNAQTLSLISTGRLRIDTSSTENIYDITTGNVFINNLANDIYTISAESSGYENIIRTVTVESNTHQDIKIYLTPTLNSSNVIFTIKDQDTGDILLNSFIEMSSFVDGNYSVIESKQTDISGKAQFYYIPNTNYRFDISLNGYSDYMFNLNPIIYDTYDIYLAKNRSQFTTDYRDVAINIYPLSFANYNYYNFSIVFNSPNSSLVSYGYTLSYPNGTVTHLGTTETGQIFTDEIYINASNVESQAILTYYTNTKISGYNNKTLIIPIYTTTSNFIGNTTGYTMMGNVDLTFGMGLIERVIITIISLIFVMGICALVGQPLIGFILTLCVSAFYVMIKFIPIWIMLPSYLIGVFILIWRGGEY